MNTLLLNYYYVEMYLLHKYNVFFRVSSKSDEFKVVNEFSVTNLII